MTAADKPQPGADLQPIETPPTTPERPERKAPPIPEDDDPAIKETEVQPT